MVYLELTKMRPLDVVLMSGTRPMSHLIKLASSVAARRISRYSHAAMMLSQSMCVEALDGQAIVTTDYATPGTLSFRWVDGRLAAYARMSDIDGALVLRHRAVTPELPADHLTGLLRYGALDVLAEVYLKQYSKLVRAPGLAIDLDLAEWAEPFLERSTALLDGHKPEPGPFCSELVCELLANKRMPRIPGAESTARADKTTPSALQWRPELEPLAGERDPVVIRNESQLPGEPCEPAFAESLMAMLRGTDEVVQRVRGTLMKAMAIMPAALAESAKTAGGQEAEDRLAKGWADARQQLRAAWVEALDRFLEEFPDQVWAWVTSANACRSTCPEVRTRMFGPPAATPRQLPPGIKTAAATYQHDLDNWAGGSCADIRRCVCAPLAVLELRIRDARMARDHELRLVADSALSQLRSAGPRDE